MELDDNKKKIAFELKVAGLNDHISSVEDCTPEKAYTILLRTRLYQLLSDYESGLFLEPNGYLAMAYDEEKKSGAEGLLKFLAMV